MRKLYGHTWGAEELFTILAADETVLQKSLARFVSTHPASTDRMQRIKHSQYGEPQALRKPGRPYRDRLADLECTAEREPSSD